MFYDNLLYNCFLNSCLEDFLKFFFRKIVDTIFIFNKKLVPISFFLFDKIYEVFLSKLKKE